jgi:hypothetical protein
MGDLAGMPQPQLAALPGTSHLVPPGYTLLDRHESHMAMIPPFLDANPARESPSSGPRERGGDGR